MLIVFALAGCAMVAVLGVIYLCVGNPLDPFDDWQFSSKVWLSAPKEQRAKMARSVIQNQLAAGVPESRIVALLGQPDRVSSKGTPGAGQPPFPGVRTYEYYLGACASPLYDMDDAYLYVSLDSTDKVVRAEIGGY